jgi:hypothetical protein
MKVSPDTSGRLLKPAMPGAAAAGVKRGRTKSSDDEASSSCEKARTWATRPRP